MNPIIIALICIGIFGAIAIPGTSLWKYNKDVNDDNQNNVNNGYNISNDGRETFYGSGKSKKKKL